MAQKIKLALASDHGGYVLKEAIKAHFSKPTSGVEIVDFGVHSLDSVDYPELAKKVCTSILSGAQSLGVLVCGTGIGVSIQANRFKGIRAALVSSTFTAQMAKEHNDANVLCLGGRTTHAEDAITYIEVWLGALFQGGRHEKRIEQLDFPAE